MDQYIKNPIGTTFKQHQASNKTAYYKIDRPVLVFLSKVILLGAIASSTNQLKISSPEIWHNIQEHYALAQSAWPSISKNYLYKSYQREGSKQIIMARYIFIAASLRLINKVCSELLFGLSAPTLRSTLQIVTLMVIMSVTHYIVFPRDDNISLNQWTSVKQPQLNEATAIAFHTVESHMEVITPQEPHPAPNLTLN